MEVTSHSLARFFEVVLPHMNEVQRRVVAGAAAEMLGRGGKTAVAEASGMSRNTVINAQGEVEAGVEPTVRLRPVGGGDKPAEVKQPGLLEALDELVHPDTRGNPMSFVRWTSKPTKKRADELVRLGFSISPDTVGRILKGLGYSSQAPAKVKEGTGHPDRDAQFGYLNTQVGTMVTAGQPVISVDTKKRTRWSASMTTAVSSGSPPGSPSGSPDLREEPLLRHLAQPGERPRLQPLIVTVRASGDRYRHPAHE